MPNRGQFGRPTRSDPKFGARASPGRAPASRDGYRGLDHTFAHPPASRAGLGLRMRLPRYVMLATQLHADADSFDDL